MTTKKKKFFIILVKLILNNYHFTVNITSPTICFVEML